MRCEHCKGDGWYVEANPDDGEAMQVQCEHCRGEGYIFYNWTCSSCGATLTSKYLYCPCSLD